MRQVLRRWIADSDTRFAVDDFRLQLQLSELTYLNDRTLDLYYSLVGELFDMLRADTTDREAWATLGRAFASISRELRRDGHRDSLFFGAVAFYCGGFPASATLTMRQTRSGDWDDEIYLACYDMLSRPAAPNSESVRDLIASVRSGEVAVISAAVEEAEREALAALQEGPDEWVPRQIRAALLRNFQETNLRAVLPDGTNAQWNPLVSSFLDRRQAVWDFFPSQIEAIEAGLLSTSDTYALQMPTGAGKTALAETLLFSHLTRNAEAKSVLLVPYRALARELRQTVGRNLTRMGMQTRAVYGGTVPTPEEGEALDSVRVIIATPEALMGLLGAQPEIAAEISLVVCDEGHLLADDSRGVSLELLLARLRARTPSPRTVFVSAIVPNIEEINAWLGGTDATVVRSTYRPAIAEYAILRPQGSGRRRTVALEFQELSAAVPAHTLPGFLDLADFEFTNTSTGRTNTYDYGSKKTQAIAAARKALAMGTVAVFAATKTGNQGVIGLADELISQVGSDLPLPEPASYTSDSALVADAVQYMNQEYGSDWTGSRALQAGVVVHHGDLPQETREVLEELLSEGHLAMVLCTSTLAEGVNLPIRTLILYSVTRGSASGESTPMLARDIKNLVGRAGRAGSSTRGLVICANEGQWRHIRPVAENAPGEPVAGALIELLRRLENALARQPQDLNNDALEETPQLLSLVDGIDAALVELIREELGDEEFLAIAASLAEETFAAQQADGPQHDLLLEVFRMRATRLLGMRSSGRLQWAQATGGRPRLVDSIIDNLYPQYSNWLTVESPLDDELLDALLQWSFEQTGFADAADAAFRQTNVADPRAALRALIKAWLEGSTHVEIAERVGLTVDQLLRIHTRVVLFDFVTLVEQAIAVLGQYVAQQGSALSTIAAAFADHLRYGVPNAVARNLMGQGMRHRRAAVEMGALPEFTDNINIMVPLESIARDVLQDSETWSSRLGTLVYQRTVVDVRVDRTPT
ncbi:DEAD/DEAH box helicase [Mycolicibacterium sp. XJ1819]